MTTTSEFIRETMLSGDFIAKLNSKVKYLTTKIEKIFKVKEIFRKCFFNVILNNIMIFPVFLVNLMKMVSLLYTWQKRLHLDRWLYLAKWKWKRKRKFYFMVVVEANKSV